MKKYLVYLPASGGASYEVEAESEQEAIDAAWNICQLSDCEIADWDHEIEPDVSEAE